MKEEPNIFDEFCEEGLGLESNQNRESVAVVMETPPRELFNGRRPLYTLMAERPEHRAVIMMKASAMSNKEIAEALGKTLPYVAYVVKQPWAQQQILEEIERAGREPVMQLMRVTAFEAAERLIEISKGAESDETRRKANNDILDRVFGKATQMISVTEKPASELSDDELARLARQSKRN